MIAKTNGADDMSRMAQDVRSPRPEELPGGPVFEAIYADAEAVGDPRWRKLTAGQKIGMTVDGAVTRRLGAAPDDPAAYEPVPGDPISILDSSGLARRRAAMGNAGDQWVRVDGRPWPANVATMTEPLDTDRWLIEGLLRPGAVAVLAGAEGVGKSFMRKEAEWRLAAGHGALFGVFAVPAPAVVITFEEENGDAEEWRRDEQMRTALGLERSSLGDRLYRLSHPGLDLTSPEDQAYIRDAVDRVAADAAFFDTGGSMIGDEWGPPMKIAMRFLHGLPCASLVAVHFVKPSRQGGARLGDHGAVLGDVMGQWTRSPDAALLVSDLGAGRVMLRTRKRIPHVDLVLAQRDGLWTKVATAEAAPGRDRTDDRVIAAIAAGATTSAEVRVALGDRDGRLLPERTFYDSLGRLRQDGYVEEGRPLRLSAKGWEAAE